jgi:hypothetical protein
LKTTIIKPGVILNTEERLWGVPVGFLNDVAYHAFDTFGKKLPFHEKIDFLFPAKSTKLTTVAHFAILGALGETKEQIYGPDEFAAHESFL